MRSLASHFVQDLLYTLTSKWLFGAIGKPKPAALDDWCASMKRAFHGKYLEELKKKPEDHCRIAFLRLMDLTLFDVVKEAIVADGAGTEKAIRTLTLVRFSAARPSLSTGVLPS